MAMLEAGPASATQTMSRRGLLRLVKFTGTGLAKPKIKGDVKYSRAGKIIVPTRSIWRRGLIEIRPAFNAVSSPNRIAA